MWHVFQAMNLAGHKQLPKSQVCANLVSGVSDLFYLIKLPGKVLMSHTVLPEFPQDYQQGRHPSRTPAPGPLLVWSPSGTPSSIKLSCTLYFISLALGITRWLKGSTGTQSTRSNASPGYPKTSEAKENGLNLIL